MTRFPEGKLPFSASKRTFARVRGMHLKLHPSPPTNLLIIERPESWIYDKHNIARGTYGHAKCTQLFDAHVPDRLPERVSLRFPSPLTNSNAAGVFFSAKNFTSRRPLPWRPDHCCCLFFILFSPSRMPISRIENYRHCRPFPGPQLRRSREVSPQYHLGGINRRGGGATTWGLSHNNDRPWR